MKEDCLAQQRGIRSVGTRRLWRSSQRLMSHLMRTTLQTFDIATMSSTAEPGGFLHPSLPSPPASSHRSASIEPSHLPQTRVHPLKPGSAKESSIIYYLDDRLLAISRRYEKRIEERTSDDQTSPAESGTYGYRSFGQLAHELEAVIDVVWVTASRTTTSPFYLKSSDGERSQSASLLSPCHSLIGLHIPVLISVFSRADFQNA